MNRDLNSINGRVLAARNAIWRHYLMDRRYLHTSDDAWDLDCFPAPPLCIINP